MPECAVLNGTCGAILRVSQSKSANNRELIAILNGDDSDAAHDALEGIQATWPNSRRQLEAIHAEIYDSLEIPFGERLLSMFRIAVSNACFIGLSPLTILLLFSSRIRSSVLLRPFLRPLMRISDSALVLSVLGKNPLRLPSTGYSRIVEAVNRLDDRGMRSHLAKALLCSGKNMPELASATLVPLLQSVYDRKSSPFDQQAIWAMCAASIRLGNRMSDELLSEMILVFLRIRFMRCEGFVRRVHQMRMGQPDYALTMTAAIAYIRWCDLGYGLRDKDA